MEKGGVLKLKNCWYKGIILIFKHCHVTIMNEYQPDTNTKKVKYIVSIIYLLVLAFIVGGSYINQQQESSVDINTEDGVIWPKNN